MDAVILLGVLFLMAAVIGGTLAYGLARSVPPENRPSPPAVLAERERARQDARQRYVDRAREQREAAARISRGW